MMIILNLASDFTLMLQASKNVSTLLQRVKRLIFESQLFKMLCNVHDLCWELQGASFWAKRCFLSPHRSSALSNTIPIRIIIKEKGTAPTIMAAWIAFKSPVSKSARSHRQSLLYNLNIQWRRQYYGVPQRQSAKIDLLSIASNAQLKPLSKTKWVFCVKNPCTPTCLTRRFLPYKLIIRS